VIEHDVTGMLCVPSWVAFKPDGILVGQLAKDQASDNSSNTIYDAKRLIGREWKDPEVVAERSLGLWPFNVESPDGKKIHYLVRHLGEESSKSPEEISMYILQELKRMAEVKIGPVTQAVITVPANFNKSQREATKTAGELAGLQVLSVIPEPTAAALYYGFLHKDETQKESVLVFDFGGGTFDVTILSRSGADFNVLATVGDMHLGGEDIDQILMDLCRVQFNRTHAGKDPIDSNLAMWKLRSACENAKRDLSTQEQVDIIIEGLFQGCDLNYRMSRPAFERSINGVLDRLQVINICNSFKIQN
jgi:molecular chaperone DnaK (HSP70)